MFKNIFIMANEFPHGLDPTHISTVIWNCPTFQRLRVLRKQEAKAVVNCGKDIACMCCEVSPEFARREQSRLRGCPTNRAEAPERLEVMAHCFILRT